MSVSRSVMWGELKGMRKVETVEQMPSEYRETLLKIIYALASTEFASVEQHQEWINKGPTAEDRFAAQLMGIDVQLVQAVSLIGLVAESRTVPVDCEQMKYTAPSVIPVGGVSAASQ